MIQHPLPTDAQLDILDAAAKAYADTPQDLVVTSGSEGERGDGVHSWGSLHYESNTPEGEGGWALDLRIWNLDDPEMLELLARYGNVLASIISALFGGGVVAAYRAWALQSRKDEDQMHTQAMEWSERLEDRLASVEGRLDTAEAQLRSTRKQLTQSQIRREELSAAIDALVERIDRLIGRHAVRTDHV